MIRILRIRKNGSKKFEDEEENRKNKRSFLLIRQLVIQYFVS